MGQIPRSTERLVNVIFGCSRLSKKGEVYNDITYIWCNRMSHRACVRHFQTTLNICCLCLYS